MPSWREVFIRLQRSGQDLGHTAGDCLFCGSRWSTAPSDFSGEPSVRLPLMHEREWHYTDCQMAQVMVAEALLDAGYRGGPRPHPR